MIYYYYYYYFVSFVVRVADWPLARRFLTVPFVFDRQVAATNHESFATLAVQSTIVVLQHTSIYGPASTSSLR